MDAENPHIMSDANNSHTWQNPVAGDNATQHNGHIYGDVQNNDNRVYNNYKTPAERLLDSLSFPGMHRYQERPLESYEGTYEWIFDQGRSVAHSCENCTVLDQDCEICDESYTCFSCRQCQRATEYVDFLRQEAKKICRWLREPPPQQIFWTSGKAGSGKSCLMKFMLEHERTRDMLLDWAGEDVILAGFFFWAAGGELEKSHVGLLRSLLHQIIRKQPNLAENLFASEYLALDRGSLNDELPWTITRLNEALRIIIADTRTTTSCFMFFMDGLDEFQGDTQDLLKALSNLSQSPNIKLWVSSRPWNVFEKAFASQADAIYVRLNEINHRDIDTYINERLTSDTGPEGTTKTFSELSPLVEAIQEKAEGVFLWVDLAVRSLRQSVGDSWSMSEMIALLDDIPSELEDFMQKIFNSIHRIHLRNAARVFLLLKAEPNIPLLWLAVLVENEWNIGSSTNKAISQSNCLMLVDDADQAVRRWCKDLVYVRRCIGVHCPHGCCVHSPPGADGHIAQEVNSFPYTCNSVSFPHRTVLDFVSAKNTDMYLSDLAGDGEEFCPKLTICSVWEQLVRTTHHCGLEIVYIGKQFIRLSEDVAISKEFELVSLTKRFDVLCQTLEHGNNGEHWAVGNKGADHQWGIITPEGFNLDSLHQHSIFMAFMLNWHCYRLFWLMFDSTPECVSHKSKQLWFGYLLPHCAIGVPRHEETESIQRLLCHGADPNQAVEGDSRDTPWQMFLQRFHWDYPDYIGDNVVPLFDLFDLLISHGCDPDTPLSAISLYKFLQSGEDYVSSSESESSSGSDAESRSDSIKVSNEETSEDVDRPVNDTILETESPAKEECSWDGDEGSIEVQSNDGVPARDTVGSPGRVWLYREDWVRETIGKYTPILSESCVDSESCDSFVPATQAFEVPSSNYRYKGPEDERQCKKIFPLIKARLVAASEAKATARAKELENEVTESVRRQQATIERDTPTWMKFDLYL